MPTMYYFFLEIYIFSIIFSFLKTLTFSNFWKNWLQIKSFNSNSF